MTVEVVVGILALGVVIAFVILMEKTHSIPDHPSNHAHKSTEITNNPPYLIILLIGFYPLYYFLYNVLEIRIEYIGIGFGSIIAVLVFLMTYIFIKDARYMDKRGHKHINEYFYNMIAIGCGAILLMLYLLSRS